MQKAKFLYRFAIFWILTMRIELLERYINTADNGCKVNGL